MWSTVRKQDYPHVLSAPCANEHLLLCERQIPLLSTCRIRHWLSWNFISFMVVIAGILSATPSRLLQAYANPSQNQGIFASSCNVHFRTQDSPRLSADVSRLFSTFHLETQDFARLFRTQSVSRRRIFQGCICAVCVPKFFQRCLCILHDLSAMHLKLRISKISRLLVGPMIPIPKTPIGAGVLHQFDSCFLVVFLALIFQGDRRSFHADFWHMTFVQIEVP